MKTSVAWGLAGSIAYLAGCDVVEPNRDLCPQTAEFGNHGCAIVQGTVTDSAGAALSGIIVGPRYVEGQACCDTSYSDTGQSGAYSFRIHWYLTPVDGARPDSLEIYVHAQRPGIGALDSVLVWIRFADVGEVAPLNLVDLVLERTW